MQQLISSVRAALTQAGFETVRAQPGVRAPRLQRPAAALSIRQASAPAAGFYDYLGLVEDAEHGLRERYGRQLTCTMRLEVYTPAAGGGAQCEDAAARVMDTLLAGIDGVRVGRVSSGAAGYDAAADAFRCAVDAELQAYWYAERAANDADLTDFILKGEWT